MSEHSFANRQRDALETLIRDGARRHREELIKDVASARSRLASIGDGCSDDLANRTPPREEWSLRDLFRHIIFVESLTTRLVEHLARGKQVVFPAGPLMIKDDGRPFRSLVAELRVQAEAFSNLATSLPEDADMSTRTRHPWFGELNCWEWMALHAVHLEDHTSQARRLLTTG